MDIKVGPVVVTLIDDDDRIVGKINSGEAFEPKSLAVWAKWCTAGGQVLDVGGYTGLYAIAAAKLGCKALAIEPLRFLATRIKANAEANGVAVDIVNAAASDRDGEAPIYTNSTHFTAGASLTKKWPSKGMVRTFMIDSLGIGHVTAIKIDVEGYELNVLKGAAALIESSRPRLLVETLNGAARKAVCRMLSAYREAGFLDGRNLVLEPSMPNPPYEGDVK